MSEHELDPGAAKIDTARGSMSGNLQVDPRVDSAVDVVADQTWSLLRDTAVVHAARIELGPEVNALVDSLHEDPLGQDDTAARLGALLDNDRARKARAARARIDAKLQREVRA
jgi:hypothetical protein